MGAPDWAPQTLPEYITDGESKSASQASQHSPSSPRQRNYLAAIYHTLKGALTVKQDRPELVRRFLEAEGDVNAIVPHSVVFAAALATQANTQAAKEAVQKLPGCPLIYAAALLGLPEVFQTLAISGADMTWRDPVGWTLLHACASSGSVPCLQRCVDTAFADVDVGDKDSDTALHVAAFAGKIEAAELLLARNANPNSLDKDSCAPIHGACRSGSWVLVERLLTLRADANAIDTRGGTPLLYAVSSHADGVETRGLGVLLAAGAHVAENELALAAKQLGSNRDCGRCISVASVLGQAAQTAALEKAEQAAAEVAAALMEEEKVQVRKTGSRKKKARRDQKKSDKATVDVKETTVEIHDSTMQIQKATLEIQEATLEAQESAGADSSKELGSICSLASTSLESTDSAGNSTKAPESAGSSDVAASETLERVPDALPLESTGDPECLDLACARQLVSDIVERAALRALRRRLAESQADSFTQPAARTGGTRAQPRASRACRRANGEMLDMPASGMSKGERKRAKLLRQRERRAVQAQSLCNCKDGCAEPHKSARFEVIPPSPENRTLRAEAPEFTPQGLVNDWVCLSTFPGMPPTDMGPSEMFAPDLRTDLDAFDAWYAPDVQLPGMPISAMEYCGPLDEADSAGVTEADRIAARRLIGKAVCRSLLREAGCDGESLSCSFEWEPVPAVDARLQLAEQSFDPQFVWPGPQCPAFEVPVPAQPHWLADCSAAMSGLTPCDLNAGASCSTMEYLQADNALNAYPLKMWYDQEAHAIEPIALDGVHQELDGRKCQDLKSSHDGCRRCMGQYRLEVAEGGDELVVLHSSEARPR